MGVESASAIESQLSRNIKMETSYLDPRSKEGPSIVGRSERYIKDARKNVNAQFDRIALLNGFTLAPFVHEYWNNDQRKYESKNIPSPAILDAHQKADGRTVVDNMTQGDWRSINPTNFEYAAYVALKQALEKIKRYDYKVYHTVFVRRTGASQRAGIFELDVVALLGYQIVVVSCTLETGNAAIKEKGMEVILRARQLGGDEAQAIVLCKGYPDTAQRVGKELYDEVGSTGAPLRVWGTDRWSNLQDEFERYLKNDLHWR